MTPPAKWLVLSDGARPTEDIYFLRSAGPWLVERGVEVRRLDTSRWQHPRWCWPWLGRLLAGANVLVCRTLSTAWIEALEAHRPNLASCHYLIDDDLGAAATDPGLPDGYRQRMAGHAARQPRLLALADEVVACCDTLAAGLGERHPRVALLEPPLLAPLPTLDHFTSSGWRLGFHGTRAHLPDLQRVIPALVEAHARHTSLHMEVMLGCHTPDALARLERLASPKPLAWRRFLAYQRRCRLHIGIAPLWPSAFNGAKSHIKFLDIAAMGGVGIYSRRAPYADIVNHGEDGLLVEDHPEAWRDAIDTLLADPVKTREMAWHAARKARISGDPARAQAFWWERTRHMGR